MSILHIGIDNGISGGLVAIGPCGSYIEGIAMPSMIRRHGWKEWVKRKKAGIITKEFIQATENHIDAQVMIGWIKAITDSRPCEIVIEECPEHADRTSIMRSMGISYGILIGSISSCLPHCNLRVVRSGNPKDSWQRALLGKVEQGGTKEAALKLARELWPDVGFLATARSKTPHTGIVDASLIAEYARRLDR